MNVKSFGYVSTSLLKGLILRWRWLLELQAQEVEEMLLSSKNDTIIFIFCLL